MKIYCKLLIFFGLIIISFTSCHDDNAYPDIPDVPFSFVINPNSTQYLELNHIGGWVYLSGGYNGLLIYRSSLTEFMAYERACPYDFENDTARVEVDESGITCFCPVCGSKYILMDGTPYDGPSRALLKQYETTYDGSLLYVYN